MHRSLRFKTIIIFTSSLSSIPLSLIQTLSKSTQLQLLIILPTLTTSSSKDIQLIHLLRESNHQIYLERCDLSNQSQSIQFIRNLIKSLQTPLHPSDHKTPHSIDPFTLKPQLTFQLHSILFFNLHPNLNLNLNLNPNSSPDLLLQYKLQTISTPLLILQLLLPFLIKSNQSTPIKIIPIYPTTTSNPHLHLLNLKSICLFQSFQSSLLKTSNPFQILPTQIPPTQSDLFSSPSSSSSSLQSFLTIFKSFLIYPFIKPTHEIIQDLLYMILHPSLKSGQLYQTQLPISSDLNLDPPNSLLLELDQNSNFIQSCLHSTPSSSSI
ncbi:hypothetical protein DFH28DRAFT_1122811 [Melampsora americana]|nr:hypothetical protein DFH28DRAFT_1122811 [Melampsora americana]